MKKIFVLIIGLITFSPIFAQQDDSVQNSNLMAIYRGSSAKINDLVHTKLDVSFDYPKAYMYGKAWITLKPHFYPTNTLTLDAKGMDIKEVSMVNGSSQKKLTYKYIDSLYLLITLDKTYTNSDKYTVYISYTAKPNELKTQGSAAITDAKGLYFINPTGEDPEKPTQIWTQGETESNSVWMPTIDKPNQKSTEEIYMTVPEKYVTLSNGLLVNQKKNNNGTRTDYWKMDLPHAPYLFFMGIGDFAIVKDKYKAMDVNYYVEKKYEPVAKKIFGNTPEMIGFYEKILGVPYQWPKYSQIVGRDYVSGAMENTTATLHQESAYQNERQLVDGNSWEETIAHELFHQWFGDLVTAESWSNLTVNESFANYSEYLWAEHKYGKDFADEHNYQDMFGYLQSNSEKKDLVRFHYIDKEEVFDAVSYNKGGRILHMLRNYVGDDAFFKSLNNYLNTNKFKTGEAGQLRLAFEETTGEDMNWFWNQWYYGNGHPKLTITYKYDAANATEIVYVKQTQTEAPFKLPIAVDIYTNNGKSRQKIWIENRMDTFKFDCKTKPYLVNVDADKILLCEKNDSKTAEEYTYQYKNAPNYLDRLEALQYFDKNNLSDLAMGLQDKFSGLRKWSINHLATSSSLNKDKSVIAKIETLANTEKDKKTLAAAISFLGKTKNNAYESLFIKNTNDISYSVAGAALNALNEIDSVKAYAIAQKNKTDAKGSLGDIVGNIIMNKASEADFDMIAQNYANAPLNQEKLTATANFTKYLLNIKDVSKIKKGIDNIMKFRNAIPSQYRSFTDPVFKQAFDQLSNSKGEEISNYLKNILN